ncbi:hypothetical protein J4230_01315 [Candidatus Woesearchaeota archaeon]|nr:hypothetical protein [Candidatus Woesearchaeota archaeon]
MSLDLRFDLDIAYSVFENAAAEWYDYLRKYVGVLGEAEERSYIERVFMSRKLSVFYDNGFLTVDPPGFWKVKVKNLENGFPSFLSIDNYVGESLYFDNENNASVVVPKLILFREYRHPQRNNHIYAYQQDNIEDYPSTLFLRNWAILCVNECLKQIF